MNKEIIQAEQIAQRIRYVCGERVLLDFDLAVLYGVATKGLNQGLKRNRERFTCGFHVSPYHGKRGEHLKYARYAFTEHGIAMLKSARACSPIES